MFSGKNLHGKCWNHIPNSLERLTFNYLNHLLSALSIARKGRSNNGKAAMFEAGYKTGFFDGAQ